MSSHYIYVQCSAEGCDAFEPIYTGGTSLIDFSDDQWEGETITALCREHEQEAKECKVEGHIERRSGGHHPKRWRHITLTAGQRKTLAEREAVTTVDRA